MRSNSLDKLSDKAFGPSIAGWCRDASPLQLIRDVCVGEPRLHELIYHGRYLFDVSCSGFELVFASRRALRGGKFS